MKSFAYCLCLSGLTYVSGSSSVPAWISPVEVQDKLAASLVRKTEITELSEAVLRGLPRNHNEDIVLSFEYDEPIPKQLYRGVPDMDIETFGDAFKILSLSTGLDSHHTDECLLLMWMFYIQRPLWYTASRQDLVQLRECLTSGLALIQAVSVDDDEQVLHGNVVAKAVAHLLPVAYSSMAELTVRAPISALSEDEAESFQFFAKFMDHHPVLRHLLDEHSAGVDGSSFSADPADLRFAEWMGTGFKHEQHAGDFVDYHWSRLALVGEGEKSLPLWNRLLRVDDMTIFDFEANKMGAREVPQHEYRSKLSLGRDSEEAWQSTVGKFIQALDVAKGEPFCGYDVEASGELFRASNEEITEFYRCVLQKVEEGELVLPSSETGNHVATLMHMARVVTSPVAFLTSRL